MRLPAASEPLIAFNMLHIHSPPLATTVLWACLSLCRHQSVQIAVFVLYDVWKELCRKGFVTPDRKHINMRAWMWLNCMQGTVLRKGSVYVGGIVGTCLIQPSSQAPVVCYNRLCEPSFTSRWRTRVRDNFSFVVPMTRLGPKILSSHLWSSCCPRSPTP